jgi:hypothetical protein
MPEIPEEETLNYWIALFISYAQNKLPSGSLIIHYIYANFKKTDLVDVAKQEDILLLYAETLTERILRLGYHRGWAVILERFAATIPKVSGFRSLAVILHRLISVPPSVILSLEPHTSKNLCIP